MNVKELIEILRKMPADMEIMMPLESNVDRPKAVYIATVAKTRRDWTMAPVGNYVVLDIDEVSKREDIAGDPYQVVMMDVDWPTWLYTDSDGQPGMIEMQQVDTLICRGFTVPVWQAVPGKGHSTVSFIRYSDIPADLIEAYGRWQHAAMFGETPPHFPRTAVWADFTMFMILDDGSENAEVLAKYRYAAQIRLNGPGFVAELLDGQRIERGALDELAEALHAAGVTAETAHCGDWRDGEQILGAGQQIALKAELRRLAGLDHVAWTTAGFDDAGSTITLNLRQVDTLTYRSITVPVWQLLPGQGNYSSNRFVRREDLPADLAEAFFDRWQYGANQPFADAAYHYDFESFMERGGKPEDAGIVARYR